MADIELIIRISEDSYKATCNGHMLPLDVENVVQGIKNGKPLPKGHGRLKDLDKIEWHGCDFEGRDCIEAKGDCSICNYANCDAKQVRTLPTIIEADKERNKMTDYDYDTCEDILKKIKEAGEKR